jgi:hypothetical protein
VTASFVRRLAPDIGVVALVTCVAGCSTSPDVVATATRPPFDGPDGGIISGSEVVECKPGLYRGNMYADSDGGIPVSFSGEITFTLVKTIENELPVLASEAHLKGMGDDMSSFNAVVPSGLGCMAGKFETELKDGQYTLPGGARMVPFEGVIEGQYDTAPPRFSGSWTSYLHFTEGAPFVVHGGWIALNVP